MRDYQVFSFNVYIFSLYIRVMVIGLVLLLVWLGSLLIGLGGLIYGIIQAFKKRKSHDILDPVEVESREFTPAVTYAEREADVRIENCVVQQTPLGPLRITNLKPTWSFHTYECQSQSGALYTIIYGTDVTSTVQVQTFRGTDHPIVHMYDVYWQLRDFDITPVVFFLGDPSPHADGFTDRFILLEAVSDRFIDRFAYGRIKTKQHLCVFMKCLVKIVDLIQRLHRSGFVMKNMHIGSFDFRKSDDAIVIWDLCWAEKSTSWLECCSDLMAVTALFHHCLQTCDVYRVVSDDLKDSVREIHRLILEREGAPPYDYIRKTLEVYV